MKHSPPKVLVAGYHAQTVNYVSALEHMGIVPVVAFKDTISADETFLNHNFLNEFDGLLLPGGGDIYPGFFNETNLGSRNIDFSLDSMQFKYLQFFVHSHKPVLGICKGLQIINVFFGGNVIQDLPTAKTHAWDLEDKIHSSTTIPGTFISNLYGNTLITNSAHHQGIGLLGEGLLLAQKAEDFVVEAIYHESFPIIAVQWHPERMCFDKLRNDTVNGEAIFQYFKDMIKKEKELP